MRKFLTMVVIGSALAGGVFGFSAGNASAVTDCSANNIMKGGASSPANFVSQAKQNTPGDLTAIYSDYGLIPSQYAKFASSAKTGTAYKDGRIVVDGQVVGTATFSIGRHQTCGNTQKQTIGGKSYWGGPNSATFGSNSLPVMVLFDDKGVMQFAVLANCGNPEKFTPVTPQYSCDALHKATVSGQANTYSFTTDASASKGAKVSKVVYDFGDGQTQTTQSLSTAVKHSFSKSSNITATVYVQVPGGTTIQVPATHCLTSVTVQAPKPPTAPKPQPKTPGITITKNVKVDGDDYQKSEVITRNVNFKYQLIVTNTGDEALTHVVVTDKAPNGVSFLSATGATIVNNGINYTIPHLAVGQHVTITITAVVTGNVTDDIVNKACVNASEVNPTQPTKSDSCDTATVSETPPEQPQENELPDTGAGSVVGIFGAAAVVGTISYRLYIGRKLNRQN